MMHILITNDDGYQAKGIQTLIRLMRPLGEITVVAPDGARSGQSSAITVGIPIRLKALDAIAFFPDMSADELAGIRMHACTGTPADCVKLAIHTLFKSKKTRFGCIRHQPWLKCSRKRNVLRHNWCLLCGGRKLYPCHIGFSTCDHSADAGVSSFAPYIPQMMPCKGDYHSWVSLYLSNNMAFA